MPNAQVYFFDQDLCACRYDPDEIVFDAFFSSEKDDPDCIPSPLEPGECYLQCQIDAIKDRALRPDCIQHVNKLDYDYRDIPSRGIYEFKHGHGQVSAALYNGNGHLGVVDGCEGLVVRRAPLGVVYPPDTIFPEITEVAIDIDISILDEASGEEINDDDAAADSTNDEETADDEVIVDDPAEEEGDIPAEEEEENPAEESNFSDYLR